MKIDRTELLKELYRFSRAGNGLILGSPGVGKSYCLRELDLALQEHDIPVLRISVEQLGSASVSDINNALRIEEPLSEKLKKEYFNSEEPGVLIIDGFDAARSLDIQSNLLFLIRDLINTLNGGWNILISVRSFDARKSKDLLSLFPLSKDQISIYTNNELECQNFTIPHLSDEEVLSVDDQIQGLNKLYTEANDDLKNILKVPFNLWLLDKLFRKKNNLGGIDQIASEVQLLDMFWSEYVSSSQEFAKKENILTNITQGMVNSYSLSVRKADSYKTSEDAQWKELYSEEILVESGITGQNIAFSHNILFDYAVSILVIDENVDKLIEFLTAKPARTLFLRPSLTYYFARVWFYDRDKYWHTFSKLLNFPDQNLKIFARIVPASIGVKLFSESSDFETLLNGLKNGDEVSVDIVTRILQAYEFVGTQNSYEWLLFLRQLSLNLKNEYIWYIAKITGQILESSFESKLENNIDICGEIGRNLLTWVWKSRSKPSGQWLDGVGADFIVPLVAKTIHTDVKQTEGLLKKVLTVVQEKDFHIKYIYRLTDLVSFIWPHSPELAEDIYRVVFSYKELSDEKTSMGTPILPLVSNRKQDFQMCHYHLVRKFPDFIENKPYNAINAGMDCLNAYIWQEHITRDTSSNEDVKELKTEFSFKGKTAAIMNDHSCIWDSRDSYRDEPLKIASTIFNFIENQIDDESFVDNVLDMFAEKAIVAFWWRRLLSLGAKHPKFFSGYLYDLCLVKEVVDGFNTEHKAVNFIANSWQYFKKNQRRKFEDFLMSIDPKTEDEKKYVVQLQEKIISRLPKKTLTNSKAITLKTSLDGEGKIVPNPPPFKIESGWRKYTDDDFLKDQGTNVEAPEIQSLKTSWGKVNAVTHELLNKTPTVEQKDKLIKLADGLFGLLYPKPIAEDGAALNKAWTELGNAVEILARYNLKFNSEEYNFVKKVLIKCSTIENPYPRDDEEASFTSPAYSPFAKTEAAQGLPWLGRLGSDNEVLKSISMLLKDDTPSVRYLSCREVWRLRGSSIDFLWKVLQDRSIQETNPVVLGALSYSLSNTFYTEKEKGVEVLKNIFERITSVEYEDDDIKISLGMILWLHLEGESDWAEKVINDVIESPNKNIELLNLIVYELLGYLTPSTLEERPDLFNEAKNEASQVITSLWKSIQKFHTKPFNEYSEDEIDLFKSLYHPIDSIISRLYFTVDSPSPRRNKRGKLSDEKRRAYYNEIKPMLFQLLNEANQSGSAAIMAPTAHHFMELLVNVVSYDVSGALKMAADLISLSEGAGYNLDSMAMSEVVKLTEIVLADHRSELRNDENINNLLRLLDAFAKTGWRDALALVWRLDEIYR